MSEPAVLVARGVRKAFTIPSVRRTTVREHVFGALERRSFERLQVLDGIDLELRRGETLGVMGRNGCGKSTLLKILAGVYGPDEGEVLQHAAITPILELGVGWNPELDAIDNVFLIGAVMGLSNAEASRALDSILAFAEVERFARLKLQHYSSGMAARLAYAVAFHAVRDVLVLDEIFAVGDAAFRARCEERYLALVARGCSVLLVSHDPELVARRCDRALLLEGGRVIVEGSGAEVASAYETLLQAPAGAGPVHAPPNDRSRAVAVGGAPAAEIAAATASPAAAVAAPPRWPEDLASDADPVRISVVVPCRDAGAYLGEALSSVFAQTRRDYEVVVVDDGSRDPPTIALLDDARWPRTRILRQPARGVSAARNAGLAAARGELICFLDADDLLEPSFLERTAAALEADASLTFASTWLRTIGDEEWLWSPERCDLETLLGEDTVLTASLVRRAAVVLAGGFDEGMPEQGYEDWDLWLTLLERGHRGTILREPLFRYRRRAGSVSRRLDDPAVERPLHEYLLAKHRESYAGHALAVLLALEGELADVLRRNDALERELAGAWSPRVAAMEDEVARLARRLAASRPSPEAPSVSDAVAAARHEALALRASWSWRVTAPLRAVGGWAGMGRKAKADG